MCIRDRNIAGKNQAVRLLEIKLPQQLIRPLINGIFHKGYLGFACLLGQFIEIPDSQIGMDIFGIDGYQYGFQSKPFFRSISWRILFIIRISTQKNKGRKNRSLFWYAKYVYARRAFAAFTISSPVMAPGLPGFSGFPFSNSTTMFGLLL